MKILCKFHKDTRPSMHIYPRAYYCFVCQASGPLSDLGMSPQDLPEEIESEDLKPGLDYIKSLPTKFIRGFDLPYDKDGYYLVWTDGEYYKKRRFEGEPRYLCPKGHKEPLYWVNRNLSDLLYIIEGQFNAMSLATVTYGDVVSPGGVGNLTNKKDLTTYSKYTKLVIVVDDDPAGRAAGISLKAALTKVPYVSLVFTDPENDLNDIHVKYGKEQLRKEFQKLMSKAL